MCAVTHRAKLYQLSFLIIKSLDDVIGLQQMHVKPLYNTSIETLISPLSMLNLQKVPLIHLKKCVFYIIYKSKWPLRVIFKAILK